MASPGEPKDSERESGPSGPEAELELELDLDQVPFSRRGSYLALSLVAGGGESPTGLYLRHIHRGSYSRLLRLEPGFEGEALPFRILARPSCLRMEASAPEGKEGEIEAGGGQAEFCLTRDRRVLVRGAGFSLRFHARRFRWEFLLPGPGEGLRLNHAEEKTQLFFRPLAGFFSTEVSPKRIRIELHPDPVTGRFAASIEEYATGWNSQGDGDDGGRSAPAARASRAAEEGDPFEAVRRAAEEEFSTFAAGLGAPPLPGASAPPSGRGIPFAAAKRLAAYVEWASLVAPRGNFKREAMLMGKHFMTQVWSWDHCFNALSLCRAFPDLAFDQFLLPFDHQDERGGLPDSVNDEFLMWNFCKMPVHGWFFAAMLRRNPALADTARLEKAYGHLARWQRWWLAFRDDEGSGLGQCNHGNDSGWDNGTFFDAGAPVQSPVLSAFLVLQAETLADLARLLGERGSRGAWAGEEAQWRTYARRTLALLLERFRDGNHLRSRGLADGAFRRGHCLFDYQVLLLGKRLPEEVRSALLEDLRRDGEFLAPAGFASESLKSPLYEADGYWRGSVWAPPQWILHEGLLACGEEGLAREAAKRFCRAAGDSGFPECLDAVTGAPQHDKAYTWTASVFLLLAERLEAGGTEAAAPGP